MQLRDGRNVGKSRSDQTGVVSSRLEQIVGVVVVGGDDEVGSWNQRVDRLGLQGLETGFAAGPSNSPPRETGVDGRICVRRRERGYR